MQENNKVIMDTRYCNAIFNVEQKTVYFSWKDRTTSMKPEDFKETILEFSRCVHEFQVEKVLTDTTSCHFTIDVNLQKWHDDVIVPKFINGGLKKMAFLISKDFFSQLSHELTFQEEKSKALLVQFFDSEPLAKEWLLNLADH